MLIHQKGPKAERDRIILLKAYRSMCKEFNRKLLKEAELVKMSNYDLDRLARDIYASASDRDVRWYAEKNGFVHRSGKFKLRWFFHDLFHPKPKRKMNPVKPFVPMVMAEAAN